MIYEKQLTEEEKDFQAGKEVTTILKETVSRTDLERIAFTILIELSKEKQIQILDKFID